MKIEVITTGDEVLSGSAEGEETIERVIGRLLRERKKTLAVAESCTGGLIAHMITNVPGSSDWFEQGVVAYSNRSKAALLKVDPKLIARHGAVSGEVAVAMAEGVRRIAKVTYGIGVTGIAGGDPEGLASPPAPPVPSGHPPRQAGRFPRPAKPDRASPSTSLRDWLMSNGGTKEKPVGTVHIAVAGPGGTKEKKYFLPGDRGEFKLFAAHTALHKLRRMILEDTSLHRR